MPNSHSIENEKVISRTENEVTLSFSVPLGSDFFDGHFPEYKLLPAVAQFELVTRFAQKYLGTPRRVKKIKRIKFSAPIFPNAQVDLRVAHDAEKKVAAFTISDHLEPEKIYSTGTFATAGS